MRSLGFARLLTAPKRRTVGFLLVAGISVVSMWAAQQKSSPTFRGMTARQWFQASNKQPNTDPFYEAISQLNTNFIPVLVDVLSKRRPMFIVEYNDLYLLSPRAVQHALPEPTPHFSQQQNALALLLHLIETCPSAQPLLEIHLELFRTLMKAPHEDISIRAAAVVYALLTGDVDRIPEAKEFLNHPDFAVRLFAAMRHESSDPSRSRDVSQFSACVPVFIEAITNSFLVNHTFGPSASHFQEYAFRTLRKLAPEAAAQYAVESQ